MGYQITWKGSNAIITLEGSVNFREISDADDQLYGDSRFDTMKCQVWDFRNVERFDVSQPEARVIGVLDRSSSVWNNHMKLAMITEDPVIIGVIREYEKELEGTRWEVRILKTMDEVEKWCPSG
jgi:hypothetical protein